MESPVKKLDFGAADKENQPLDQSNLETSDRTEATAQKPLVEEVKKVEKETETAVAPTIKPEESDEPILQENPQRFVLFPIKYHEVRNALTRKVV